MVVLAVLSGLLAGGAARLASERFVRRPEEGCLPGHSGAASGPLGRAGVPDAAAGLLCLGLSAVGGLPLPSAVILTFAVMTVALVDLRYRLIPDVATAVIGILALITPVEGAGSLALRLATAGGLGGVLLLLHLSHRWFRGEDGVGLGDVKLLAALALWLTPVAASLMLASASLSALIWLRMASLAGTPSPGMPLAPFAVLAFLVALLSQGGLAP